MSSPIDGFRGRYNFLSNFYKCMFHVGKFTYLSVEHYYQSRKTTSLRHRIDIMTAPFKTVKKLGRAAPLRDDWNELKDSIMEKALHAKFTQNHKLTKALLATGDAELIEGNWWGDTYWGVCHGVGENKLGKLLMKIRSELKANHD